jgi:hypothetical protein
MDQLDNRVDETLTMLRAAAIEQQMPISGDDRIGESAPPRARVRNAGEAAGTRKDAASLQDPHRVARGNTCSRFRPATEAAPD